MGNARNKVAESLYLRTGLDTTLPIQIYGLVNRKCNARYTMCESWKKDKEAELPASVWIRLLKSLKSFSKGFHINFSGGEPLLCFVKDY